MGTQTTSRRSRVSWVVLTLFGLLPSPGRTGEAPNVVRLESAALRVDVDARTGQLAVVDKASDVRWPSAGLARAGEAAGLRDGAAIVESLGDSIRIRRNTAVVTVTLVDEGRGVELRFEGKDLGDVRALDGLLGVRAAEQGAVVVPCREGLLLPADSGVAFKRTFGASEYEGCHMNMLGLLKSGSALIVSWDGADVWPEVQRVTAGARDSNRRLEVSVVLKAAARALRLTPLGRGDVNAIAAGYRRIAEAKGLAATLRDKVRRDAHAERMIGAANVKLWTCLARRMNEESTAEESVNVRWTFAEAAAIAEHVRKDLDISRCLFMLGGWTEGGYDCRHPDNLPANPECGGNQGLAAALRKIQDLGFLTCLHDNYQDMYRDAKSWNPALIEKRADGSLITGGRWLGGRAYMVCAPKQVELAMRPQNLPAIRQLFDPWCYFIDTTYAVGPRVCASPDHPLSRDDDIAWKIILSDRCRELMGLFGSECGREWALPHSDFFEGLVGVSGHYFHNLKPDEIGAVVIPFFEMVYHDCQICYGKYGYAPDQAGEYVAHHVLCARPLNYHSIPDHRYWLEKPAAPAGTGSLAAFARSDRGWAEGLHPTDVFLKTTQEVLGPLHAATAYERLRQFEFLDAKRGLRRAVYGAGEAATVATVNFAAEDAVVSSPLGGEVTLPQWGFVVEGPRFVAFYAKRWGGREYPDGALFTLRSQDDQPLARAGRVRVLHCFGDPVLRWRNKEHEVQREEVLSPQ